MDERIDVERRDDRELRQLWNEAAWGAGLIGSVLVIVALIASFAAA